MKITTTSCLSRKGCFSRAFAFRSPYHGWGKWGLLVISQPRPREKRPGDEVGSLVKSQLAGGKPVGYLTSVIWPTVKFACGTTEKVLHRDYTTDRENTINTVKFACGTTEQVLHRDYTGTTRAFAFRSPYHGWGKWGLLVISQPRPREKRPGDEVGSLVKSQLAGGKPVGYLTSVIWPTVKFACGTTENRSSWSLISKPPLQPALSYAPSLVLVLINCRLLMAFTRKPVFSVQFVSTQT